MSVTKGQEITTKEGDKLKAVGNVSSLHIFPVKSCARMNVNSINCTETGVELPEQNLSDRYFTVFKRAGFLANMAEFPRMALIIPSVSGGKLYLNAPDMSTLIIPCKVEKTDSSVLHTVKVGGKNVHGIDCGKEASEWISKFLGKPDMKLLCFDPTIQKRLAKEGLFHETEVEVPDSAQVFYSNESPFMLMSEASVELLNTHLKKPVTIHNFRPNIVVKGCEANFEDTWDKVQIGSASFKLVTHNPRCPVTTVDPVTGIKDPNLEPLRTLRTYRPIVRYDPNKKSPMLGVYLILEKAGKISVGDTVYASVKSPEWI